MSEFSLHKTIAFCHVNMKLLAEIESFILGKVPTLVNIPENQLKERYGVSIEDDSGTEEFQSIREYGFELLPDKTQEISLRLNMYSPKIRIRVNFIGGETGHSCISIAYEGENAKMVAKDICEHINILLHQSSNHNWIFHPLPYGLTTIFAVVISTALGIISFVNAETTISALIYFLGILLCLSYAAIGIWLKPIILFDSKRSRTLDSFGRWAFGVLIALIVSISGTAIWEFCFH